MDSVIALVVAVALLGRDPSSRPNRARFGLRFAPCVPAFESLTKLLPAVSRLRIKKITPLLADFQMRRRRDSNPRGLIRGLPL